MTSLRRRARAGIHKVGERADLYYTYAENTQLLRECREESLNGIMESKHFRRRLDLSMMRWLSAKV